MSPGLRCPICEAAGQRSEVRQIGAAMTTLMSSDRYWDEDGCGHVHDPNAKSAQYRCSNGHTWTRKWREACSVDGCSWNDQKRTFEEVIT